MIDAGHWSTCQWIEHRGRTPSGTKYCGAASNGRSSYCELHHAVCYKPLKKKRKSKKVAAQN